MPPADADFSFKIDFEKGAGDPRRVFDAASRLIDGLEDLDAAVLGSVDPRIKTSMVLDDVESGSLRIFLRTILEQIDDDGLRRGEWKKAIGPALVRAKYTAIEYLNKDENDASNSTDELRDQLRAIASQAGPDLLGGSAPLHEGRLISSLDKIQDAKRLLTNGKDRLTVEVEGKIYNVDLSKTWSPDDVASLPPPTTSERQSPAEVILTVRKPDLLGKAQWQFWHGKIPISASVKDENWLAEFHDRKIPILPGDALRCSANFTYILDENGIPIEQKTEILTVHGVIEGGGRPRQTTLFGD